jgi:hypothetical protein
MSWLVAHKIIEPAEPGGQFGISGPRLAKYRCWIAAMTGINSRRLGNEPSKSIVEYGDFLARGV